MILNKSILSSLLILGAAILFLVEITQGVINGGDISKAGTNTFAIAYIATLLMAAGFSKSFSRHLINKDNIKICTWSFFTIAIALTLGAMNGTMKYDAFALLRSIVLGFLVFNLCRSVPEQEKNKTLTNLASTTWVAISALIVFGKISGYGLYTYEEFETGYKFFFPSVNELTFVYFSSLIILCENFSTKLRKASIITVTVLVFLVIGNKSFIALFALYLSLSYFLKLPKRTKAIYLSLLAISAPILLMLGVFDWAFRSILNVAIFILSENSSSSTKLLTKLSYLDPFSALISERDTLFMIAQRVYSMNYGILETLFGTSYSIYGDLYGALRGGADFSFSEIDIVDLFMSYGLNGSLLFFAILYKIYASPTSSAKFATTKKILVIVFALNGTLTGHIFFFGFPVMFFAIYTGLTTSRRKLSNYEKAIRNESLSNFKHVPI